MLGESASKGSHFVRDKGTALMDNYPEVAEQEELASRVKHDQKSTNPRQSAGCNPKARAG